MGRKAVLKDLVDIVMMLKQDEEDKEKPEEEYKVEIPEGLRRKVQAILREKHKVKALAPDTGKWGGPTALSSNGHGRGSTGKSTIQNAEEDELQKEIAYRQQFPYVPQAYSSDIADSGGTIEDTAPRKRTKKHWTEPGREGSTGLEPDDDYGEGTPLKPSKLHPNIGTDNWSVQAADEKELKRFPPNI